MRYSMQTKKKKEKTSSQHRNETKKSGMIYQQLGIDDATWYETGSLSDIKENIDQTTWLFIQHEAALYTTKSAKSNR